MEQKKEKRKFLKAFFSSDNKQVGAIAPSSQFMVRKMCSKIDFKNAKCILELGPGTGVFTEELLKRAPENTKIILVELNQAFYDILTKKFDDPRIKIYMRSADEIDEILKEEQLNKVDAVLSSLPFTVMPDMVTKRIIIQCFNSLKVGGVFTQYQYSLNAKKLLEAKFGSVRINFVPINIPPAFVYTAKKLPSDLEEN